MTVKVTERLSEIHYKCQIVINFTAENRISQVQNKLKPSFGYRTALIG
jgi:hypothetical protein